MVTIAAGVAVAQGVEAATGLRAQLKWPNDVCVGPRKLAGVLAEANTSTPDGACGPYVILGFGINVLPAAYPPDVALRATSLEGELGRHVDRGLVFAECLSALAERYADLMNRRTADVIAAWRARAATTLRRRVRFETAGAQFEGVAEDVDETGALLVRTTSATIRVTSGEVNWL
jgi:BirA family biotin operon repressor/biotin-[acetyl-CoA-carboxylase] ligase